MMKKIFYILLTALLLVGCGEDNDSSATSNDQSSDGQGGSLARFILKGNYLYTVDEEGLNVFNIDTKENPVKVNQVPVGFDIETLFSDKDYLYIGSRNGMFIYSIENPEEPKMLSSVQHFTACDPVIANDTHAFVTLHTNFRCGGDVNALEIYDINDIENPKLVSRRNLTEPRGIGLYHNFLIVCDDEIKIFDITDPTKSKLVNSYNRNAFDVIVRGDHLFAIGNKQLSQFNLSLDPVKGVLLNELSELTFN